MKLRVFTDGAGHVSKVKKDIMGESWRKTLNVVGTISFGYLAGAGDLKGSRAAIQSAAEKLDRITQFCNADFDRLAPRERREVAQEIKELITIAKAQDLCVQNVLNTYKTDGHTHDPQDMEGLRNGAANFHHRLDELTAMSSILHDRINESNTPVIAAALTRINELPATEGTFRLSARKDLLDESLEKIEAGNAGELINEMARVEEPHLLAGVVKALIGQRGLLQESDYQPVKDAVVSGDNEAVARALGALPEHTRELLNTLVKELDVFLRTEQTTKMDTKNLGVVFGPSLTNLSGPMDLQDELRKNTVFKYLLDNRATLLRR